MQKIDINPVLNFTQLKPAQLIAPAQNVEHFQQLLTGLKETFKTSSSALDTKITSPSSDQAAPSLLAKSAVELNKAEFYISRLQRHLMGSIQQLEGGHTTDGNFAKAVTQQQFSSAYYFLGVSRVGNTAEDVSEEVTSVTRRR